ncbi:MAG: hypothetical protein E6X14_05840 [Clostridium celatum]|nr:hypothetical protein [Clostridium celatum]
MELIRCEIIGELSEEAKRNVKETIRRGIEEGRIDLSPEKLEWARKEKERIRLFCEKYSVNV